MVNHASEAFCRRCHLELNVKRSRPVVSPKDAAKRSSPIWSLLALTLVGAAVWYIYTGMEKSVAQVQANDAKRVANQAKDPSAGLTRTQYDQQRAGQYGNAIQSSQGLNASQAHTNEINQLMNRTSGK